MADGFIIAPPDSTGKYIDTEELVVGTNTVERQRIRVAGPNPTDLANVQAFDAGGGDNGLIVRPANDSQYPIVQAPGSQPIAVNLTDFRNLNVNVGTASAPPLGTVTLIAAPPGGYYWRMFSLLLYHDQATPVIGTVQGAAGSPTLAVLVPPATTLVIPFPIGFAFNYGDQVNLQNPDLVALLTASGTFSFQPL